MTTTTNIGLTIIPEGLLQKEAAINANSNLLDTTIPLYMGESASDPSSGTYAVGSFYYNTTNSNYKVLKSKSPDVYVELLSTITWGDITGTLSAQTDLQSALDAKQDVAIGTASRVVVTDGSGDIAVSSITTTELDYLDGVTSNIQTQIDGLSGGSFYGTSATHPTSQSAGTSYFNTEVEGVYTLASTGPDVWYPSFQPIPDGRLRWGNLAENSSSFNEFKFDVNTNKDYIVVADSSDEVQIKTAKNNHYELLDTLTSSDFGSPSTYEIRGVAISGDQSRVAVTINDTTGGTQTVFVFATSDNLTWSAEDDASSSFTTNEQIENVRLNSDGSQMWVATSNSGTTGSARILHYTRSGSVWSLDTTIFDDTSANTRDLRLAVGYPTNDRIVFVDHDEQYIYVYKDTAGWAQEHSVNVANPIIRLSVNSDCSFIGWSQGTELATSVTVYTHQRTGTSWAQNFTDTVDGSHANSAVLVTTNRMVLVDDQDLKFYDDNSGTWDFIYSKRIRDLIGGVDTTLALYGDQHLFVLTQNAVFKDCSYIIRT